MKRNGNQFYTTLDRGAAHGMATAIAIVFCATLPLWGAIPMVTHIILGLAFVIHMYLTETNIAVHWSVQSDWYKGWMKYRSLPKQYIKTIGVSADEYYNFTDAQRGAFIKKVNAIHENYEQRMAAKGLDDGLVSRMNAILQADDHAIMIEKETQKELLSRGWKP